VRDVGRALAAPPDAPTPALDAAREVLDALAVPAEEVARLGRFVALWDRLEREADRLGAAGTLRLALEETDLVAALAATTDGAQKIANVQRLTELAELHD